MLTVSTVNVNGLRAAARKGFREWLASTAADVVCLQEVRAVEEQLPEGVSDGWFATYAHGPKGRAGVAVYTRAEPSAVRVGFGTAEFEDSGRYVEVTLPGIVIGSVYVPSGDVGTERQEEKNRFMAAFLPYLAELSEKASTTGSEVLVCGDWNIAHRDLDLKNWRGNRGQSGCLPEERAWLDSIFADLGYVDVVRAEHPDVPGPYTWWSYRGKAFDHDTGWRIDLQVATPGLAARATTVDIERAASYGERWSDHAPVTITYSD
ncbi:exodeoxyribonuclease III [Actinocrispum wychmicini]|uniref:Exodeoxyribonuclease-3 n=1 Tax=Actinocrispum wychmicini TaxID=1213861 RepID=A0A4R2JZT6_9PSEU|nr:exodeoxyribonuclease III [Actinocrispum wychmicini]TCO65514.1 exodeoxyribonuclease-3 [Actinocrispum wychmicini]